MPSRIVISDRAQREYDYLLDYLFEEWGEVVAVKIGEGLFKTMSNIQAYPEHYPIFFKTKKIRRCVASPQTSIFFKVYKDEIVILSIFDNRQSPRKLKL